MNNQCLNKEAHKIAEGLAEKYRTRNLNEADTRHNIVDVIIHDVLAWPRSPQTVKCEKYIHEGYIDYLLHDQNGNVVLLIEAKREGTYFNLPPSQINGKSRWIRLKTLMTNKEIKEAVIQAHSYCAPNGYEFAAITNGHEWIIFKAISINKAYIEFDAFVITQLDYFSEEFTSALEMFSYGSITNKRSLKNIFSPPLLNRRESFAPKDSITRYDEPRRKNEYAQYLEPLASRFLRDIPKEDIEFMDGCYVTNRSLNQIHDDINYAIADVITPYFQNVGFRETSDTPTGGSIGKRISKHILGRKGRALLILFAGAGSGKTTFLDKLFFHSPPKVITDHAWPIILDLRYCSQDPAALEKEIWSKLCLDLDRSNLLSGTISELIELFHDRYELSLKQDLSDYPKESEMFISKRNNLISQWKEDIPYLVKKLRDRCVAEGKLPIIIIDNTDQLPGTLQDLCFLAAQKISSELDCLVIISMREERFFRAQTSGVLDAYHNNGFHLAAPDPTQVFMRRVEFMIKKINDPVFYSSLWSDAIPTREISTFLNFCLNEFSKQYSPLKDFLANCSQGNIRDALAFFRGFISSGYTDVNSIVRTPGWTLQPHQVVKPMMIPERHNYDEETSRIPNIYQLRSVDLSSHFTGLRLLQLTSARTADRPSRRFVTIKEILNYFDITFGMRTECEMYLDVFLRHSIFEANNRLDSYQVEGLVITPSGERKTENIYADQVKITNYGQYIFKYLCRCFIYIDLTSLDTAIKDEALFHEFVNSANLEFEHAINMHVRERLELRLERVRKFLEYLINEEQAESEYFQLSMNGSSFSRSLQESYIREKEVILKSAERNYIYQ